MAITWPLKLHYLLWFGSLSGILPFVSIFAREHLKISAEHVGILFCILPFIVSLLKPLICSIADRYDSHTGALLLSQSITLLGYGLLVSIPWLLKWIQPQILWWIFCTLILAANTAMGSGISLSDYLVINEVEQLADNRKNSFGSYRIWGTIGYGVFGILSGIVNDHYDFHLPYLIPGLIMFIVIEFFDIATIWKFYRHKPQEHESQLDLQHQHSSNIGFFKSIIKIFEQIYQIYRHYPTLLQHSLIILIFGILTSFHWSFFFWYLEDLRGKDSLLMGLCIFVESFLGEIPIFYLSDRIIQYFGPIYSQLIALFAFSLRYFAYGYVLEQNNGLYWDVLTVEILQGLTFSLFYSCMTHVANYYANKCDNIDSLYIKKKDDDNEKSAIQNIKHSTIKPSATMQSLFSSYYEGIGLGIGSLIGGHIINAYGIRSIWCFGTYLSILIIILNIFIELIKKISNEK